MANLFPPHVNVKQNIVELGKRIAFRTMFSVTDLDQNNPITRYRFRDNNNLNYSGFFTIGNVVQAANTWVEIASNQLNRVFYNAALTVHNESFSVQVYDGKFWSNVDADQVFSVTPNTRRPRLGVRNGRILATETMHIESLINVFDPDGYPTAFYSFVDRALSSNSGHFTLRGERMPSGQWFVIRANELPGLRYVGGRFGPYPERIGVRVNDGKFWSATRGLTVTTDANRFMPVVTAYNLNTPTGRMIDAISLFGWTDRDGNTAKMYSFYDTGPSDASGFFSIDGVRQEAKRWITVQASKLDAVHYHVAQTNNVERFWVRVFDGSYWSTAKAGEVNAVPRPVINVPDHDVSVDTLEEVTLGTMFTKVDNGPAYTHYQVLDSNDFFQSARVTYNQAPIEQGVIRTFTASQFANVEFRGGISDPGRQLDPVMVRAYNGLFWTDWERINVNTDPVGPRALEITQWHVYDDGEKHRIPFTFIDGWENGVTQAPRPPLASYYADNDPEANNTYPLNNAQRAMIREVLEYVEQFTDIDFIEVPFDLDASRAAITFGTANLPAGVGAWAYLPAGDGKQSKPGDIWYNRLSYDPLQNIDVSLGSFMRTTTYHELGHALGFKHPFQGDPQLPLSVDWEHNTVMSYRTDFSHHPEFASTMMLYDLMGLQNLYRPNEEWEAGNNQYFYDLNDSHLQMLWDAGGIDTLNLTNHVANETIDLREGQWSSLNGVVNSLIIAYGTTIENVRGGFGNDSLTGNETRNLLFGNPGNDTLIGMGGNDVLRGGAGSDTYVWRLGDNRDTIREERLGGRDVIEFRDIAGMDALEDDFVFRAFGRDLRIDLTLDQAAGQGSLIIKDFEWGGSRVEILRMFGTDGRQIGEDIELNSIFLQADTRSRRFRVTDQFGTYGYLATPV